MGDHVISALLTTHRAGSHPHHTPLPFHPSHSLFPSWLTACKRHQSTSMYLSKPSNQLAAKSSIMYSVSKTAGQLFRQLTTQRASHKSVAQPASRSVSQHLLVLAISKNFLWLSSPPLTPGHTHRHMHADTCRKTDIHVHKLAKWLLLSHFVTPCSQTSSSASTKVSHLFTRCFSFNYSDGLPAELCVCSDSCMCKTVALW